MRIFRRSHVLSVPQWILEGLNNRPDNIPLLSNWEFYVGDYYGSVGLLFKSIWLLGHLDVQLATHMEVQNSKVIFSLMKYSVLLGFVILNFFIKFSKKHNIIMYDNYGVLFLRKIMFL